MNLHSPCLQAIKGQYISKDIVHPYELALYKKSLDYLIKIDMNDIISNHQGYFNNVVIMDIFDRSKNMINDSHTIVLWKKILMKWC